MRNQEVVKHKNWNSSLS